MTQSAPITGAQKAAAFLLSLDKTVAAEVMRHLDPKVVADVAEAMTELRPELCSPEAVDGLFEDLARTVFQRAGVRSQDDYELHDILEATYGAEEAKRVVDAIHQRRRENQPFDFVEAAPASMVARVLSEESPGIIALILAHVDPGTSAEVLSNWEPEIGLEIVSRMTSIDPPGIETMLTIADDIRTRLNIVASGPVARERKESLRTVADLLNFSKPEIERTVLEGIEERDESTAQEIREFMFTWADIGAIDKRAMQKILASVDTRTLAMSLKASPPDVEANIMDNMSTRVRDMVADERELAGPVPLSEVEAARNEILKSVRSMMEAGEFSPTRAGEELVT